MQTRGHVRSIIQIIPVLVMVLVAMIHMVLVATKDLSPWRMGGFGMFSSIDSEANRFIKAYALVGATREDVTLSGYDGTLLRIKVLPAETALQRLLAIIACDSSILPGGAEAVQLEYYVGRYQRSTISMVPTLGWIGEAGACAE